MQLELALLGPLHISLNGNSITTFRSDKERALLLYLALENGRPHRRETLAALLWGEQPQELAFNNLRKTLHRLRQTLQEESAETGFLLITAKEIRWNTAVALQIDLEAFNDYIAQSQRHVHRRAESCRLCQEWLEAAVALYRSHFLENFAPGNSLAFEEWASMYRESLRVQAIEGLGRLIRFHEGVGTAEQAAYYAQRLAVLEPWHELAHRTLMRTYSRQGRRAAALAQFHLLEQLLNDELGIAPDEATIRLYQQIKGGKYEAAHSAQPVGFLPQSLTSFVGREAEQGALTGYLSNPATRLLTIVGPGGIGKTRLAIQVAEQVRHDFPGGVWFVRLDEIGDQNTGQLENRLAAAIAAVLNITFAGSQEPKTQLLNALKYRNCLLLLDNFETAMGAAGLILEILQNAPQIALLVTSREPLQFQAERLYRLVGLPFPGEETEDAADFDSVRLFRRRAERASGRPISTEAIPDIAAVCRFVVGIPLAIELAACWTPHLTLAEILTTLQAQYNALAFPLRDIPARHSTMQAVFEGSWRLLTAEQQTALAQVSIFRSGFTGDAAQAVIGDLSGNLEALVEKSLLRFDAASGRYDMHDLLRSFAAEKLAEQDETEQLATRHFAFFLSLTNEAHARLRAADQLIWLEKLDRESGNLAAALMVGRATTDGLRLVSLLSDFWLMRGRWREGLSWLEMYLNEPESDAPPEAKGAALIGAAQLAWKLGDYDLVWQKAAEAYAIWEESDYPIGLGQAHFQLGMAAYGRGHYETAESHLTESIRLFRANNSPWELAMALDFLGAVIINTERLETAQAMIEEAHDIFAQMGDRWGLAQSLNFLGGIAMRQERRQEARELYEQCLAVRREFKDRGGVALILNNLGELARYQDDLTQAQAFYQESLAAHREIGSIAGEALLLHNLGHVAQLQGNSTKARNLFQEGLASYSRQGSQLGMIMCLAGLAESAVATAISLSSDNQSKAEKLGQAAVLFGAVERGLATIKADLDLTDRVVYDQQLALLRANLEPGALAAGWRRGTAMELEEAAQFILAQ